MIINANISQLIRKYRAVKFGNKNQKPYLCAPNQDSVAQQVEHNTFNVGVLGSSPSWITKTEAKQKLGFFVFAIQMVKLA